jgi:protein MpaA
VSDPEAKAKLDAWCGKVRAEIRKMGWAKLEPCEGLNWKIGGYSVQGNPLVYAEYGNPEYANRTLVLTMVHGDENTPLYLGLKLAHWMVERIKEHEAAGVKTYVVLAPLVNPDGFFNGTKTRTNARKVDVNRNFATSDFQEKALKVWKTKYRADKRRYPGEAAASEPETLFQQELIGRIKPQKVLSVHAPLNFLDYDGPSTMSLDRFPKDYVRECMKLRSRLKAITGVFYPGSLGNYSGQELGIPTLTLELPTSDPAKAEGYWNRFRTGIHTMIDFEMPTFAAKQ